MPLPLPMSPQVLPPQPDLRRVLLPTLSLPNMNKPVFPMATLSSLLLLKMAAGLVLSLVSLSLMLFTPPSPSSIATSMPPSLIGISGLPPPTCGVCLLLSSLAFPSLLLGLPLLLVTFNSPRTLHASSLTTPRLQFLVFHRLLDLVVPLPLIGPLPSYKLYSPSHRFSPSGVSPFFFLRLTCLLHLTCLLVLLPPLALLS